MEKVSVIGSGTMGHSIAISMAWGQCPVTIYCVSEEEAVKAGTHILMKLEVMIQNEAVHSVEAEEIKKRITTSTNLEDVLKDTTFVIEAITENLEMKKELYNTIAEYIEEDVVLASNTSGFMPTELSCDFEYPEQFIVTHFWNPAHLIPLVEIVPSNKTGEKTIERTKNLLKKINKKPIVLKKEVTGFIGNRLQYAMLREAQYLLDNGYADKEDIDASVTYSIGRRYPVTGPLMTADLGGLDVFSSISDYLFKELSNEDSSGESISSLVREGSYGIKNGSGFYDWNKEFADAINKEREKTLIEFLKQDRKEV